MERSFQRKKIKEQADKSARRNKTDTEKEYEKKNIPEKKRLL